MQTSKTSGVCRSLASACLLLVVGSATYPQSSGGAYEVRAHALSSGGRASAGSFSVHAVIGQAAVGTSNGAAFSVSAGLLRQRAALPEAVFANGFE